MPATTQQLQDRNEHLLIIRGTETAASLRPPADRSVTAVENPAVDGATARVDS